MKWWLLYIQWNPPLVSLPQSPLHYLTAWTTAFITYPHHQSCFAVWYISSSIQASPYETTLEKIHPGPKRTQKLQTCLRSVFHVESSGTGCNETVSWVLEITMNVNDLLPNFQSAYRGNHSTETALLRVLDDFLYNANNDSKLSVLTLLDLSAAFDMIDHDILLHRLQHIFGIPCSPLALRSYLTDREQICSISGNTSDPSNFLYGIPQGSVLGPLLFSAFQPLSSITEKHSVSHSEFADDTQLYNSRSALRNHIHSLISNKESCIFDVKLKQWMTAENKLQLNDGKMEALLIDIQNSQNIPLSLSICQASVLFAKSTHNLGVLFDLSVSMKQQVHKICQTTHLELCIRHYLIVEATKTLVTSLVLYHLDYFNSLLAGISQNLTDGLQKVQNSNFLIIIIIIIIMLIYITPSNAQGASQK